MGLGAGTISQNQFIFLVYSTLCKYISSVLYSKLLCFYCTLLYANIFIVYSTLNQYIYPLYQYFSSVLYSTPIYLQCTLLHTNMYISSVLYSIPIHLLLCTNLCLVQSLTHAIYFYCTLYQLHQYISSVLYTTPIYLKTPLLHQYIYVLHFTNIFLDSTLNQFVCNMKNDVFMIVVSQLVLRSVLRFSNAFFALK